MKLQHIQKPHSSPKMVNAGLVSVLILSLLAVFALTCNGQARKVHVVYMGDRIQGEFGEMSPQHHLQHISILQTFMGSATAAKDSLVYSYGRSLNGFAAKLTDEEAAMISNMEGVVSVFPNHVLKLHTTRSWDFMGLPRFTEAGPPQGDVVIGMIDTGIWPESESFSDDGFGGVPSKWKGACTGDNFPCNNKLIGARYYNSEGIFDENDYKSPRDSYGHGTHTSSTAAGREVLGASYYGLAEGLARGGVPNGRIAMYKVCWLTGCYAADILAAFDDAIADGVDVISVSLGTRIPLEYFEDPIAIGSYHAMKHNILTSNSAGNSGPFPETVSNYAPWSLTVAASSIDRRFIAQVVLGNGQAFTGLSINSFELNGITYPLVWGGDAANYSAGSNPGLSKFCYPDTMNSFVAEGKIVFCEALYDGSGILQANGVGAIMASSRFTDLAFNYPLPATVISLEDGQKILNYIRTTESPTATILFGETPKDVAAPIVVSFSSRGPNPISPGILKPDITAPGVDILAAWSPASSPSIYYGDTRSVSFNIISGTSMSCPHVSGAAAYVKAAHPDWSPSAIKSALMTTAYIMDPKKHEEREFAYGAGHINPVGATDPGLVYDACESDYIKFLCTQGYNSTTLKLITGDNSSVCEYPTPWTAWDLNYPTFALAVQDGQPIEAVFTRTVTNVGPANSSYTLEIDEIFGPFAVSVEPANLTFSATGEKKKFVVKVTGPSVYQLPIVSGEIVWNDGFHIVRSPLVVYTVLQTSHSPLEGKKKTTTYGAPSTFGVSSLHNTNGILGDE